MLLLLLLECWSQVDSSLFSRRMVSSRLAFVWNFIKLTLLLLLLYTYVVSGGRCGILFIFLRLVTAMAFSLLNQCEWELC